jgi:hypothetical protein
MVTPTFSIPRWSKIYPNWDFWFENRPSGNPADMHAQVHTTPPPHSEPCNKATACQLCPVHCSLVCLLSKVMCKCKCVFFKLKKSFYKRTFKKLSHFDFSQSYVFGRRASNLYSSVYSSYYVISVLKMSYGL